MSIRTSLTLAILLSMACISAGVAADTGTDSVTSSFSVVSISGTDEIPGMSAASFATDSVSGSMTFSGRDLLTRWHMNTSSSTGGSSAFAGSILDLSSPSGLHFSDFVGNAMDNYDPSNLPSPQQLRRRALAIRSSPLNCFM